MSSPRVIVALDFSAEDAALNMAAKLDPTLCRLKVGKELFVAAGPRVAEKLVRLGFDVFLDLKFHDIPNTVAAACRVAASLGVWMLNVHAAGGRAMLTAAREALPGTRPKLIAVTLLTSLGDDDLNELGFVGRYDELVVRWSKLAQSCGLDGIVCSALEAKSIRRCLGNEFLVVTPGIRIQESAQDDQKRFATPKMAIANGADYLVIGRPITQAQDPCAVLRSIGREIDPSFAK